MAVEKVIGGCPLCGGDVRGSGKYRYFCKRCNLLFTKRELNASKEQLERHVKKTIVKKVDRKLLKRIHGDEKDE